MKRFFLFFFTLCFISFSVHAQGLSGMIKNATKKDSSGKSSVGKMLGKPGGKSVLSNDEIVNGLKTGEVIAATGAYLIYSEMVLNKGADPMSGMKMNQ